MKRFGGILGLAMLLAGCSAVTKRVGTVHLELSNRDIEVVEHRTDSHECAVGWVLQTYDAGGMLIDAKSGSGNALHCQVLQAGIQAGGAVGASAVLRPDRSTTTIDNSNSVSASARAKAAASQQQSVIAPQSNPPSGGDSQHGNNGGGNGGGDGSPNGHDDTDR